MYQLLFQNSRLCLMKIQISSHGCEEIRMWDFLNLFLIAVPSNNSSIEKCSSVDDVEHRFKSTITLNRELLIGARYNPPTEHIILIIIFAMHLRKFAHRSVKPLIL